MDQLAETLARDQSEPRIAVGEVDDEDVMVVAETRTSNGRAYPVLTTYAGGDNDLEGQEPTHIGGSVKQDTHPTMKSLRDEFQNLVRKHGLEEVDD